MTVRPARRRRARSKAPTADIKAAPKPLALPTAPASGRTIDRWLALAEGHLASPRALYVAVALAALLRIAHLAFNARNPEVNTPILDHQAYDVLAQRIAAGDWLGHHAFWADPLYAYTLAVLYTVVGHSPAMVRVMQLGCGLGTVALTGHLAQRITRSVVIGHAAAFVAALYVPAIHYEAQLEKAAFSTLLATAALVLLLHPHRRAPLAAGIVAGLATLARGNTLLLIPYGAAVLYTQPQNSPDAVKPRRGMQPIDTRRRAITFAVAALAVISVVTVRNYAVSGQFVLTTANFGQNLYIAQLPANTYGVYVPPNFIRPVPDHEEEDFRAEAEQRTGHSPMGPRECSSFWAGEGLAEIADDPGAAFGRTLHKLRLTFHSFEVPDNDDVGLAAHYSPVLRLPVFWMGQLAPFALLGLLAWWKRSREARVIAGAGALYAATLLVFFVTGRFRLPMVPVVIAFATAGGAWLLSRLRAADFDAWRGRLTVTAVVALLCLWPTGWMDTLGNHSLAVSYNNVAAQLLANHDVHGAEEAYEEAIRLDPEGVLGAARALGDLYLRDGAYADAERVMRLVLHYRPNSNLGRSALVRLAEARRAAGQHP